MYFTPTLAILSLLGAASLSGLNAAFLQMGRLPAKELFKKHSSLFFFQHLLSPLFPKRKWEGLFFALSASQQILLLTFALFSLLSYLQGLPHDHLLLFGLGLILLFLGALLLAQIVARLSPSTAFRLFAAPSSLFLFLFAPATALAFRLFPKVHSPLEGVSLRNKLLEVLYESDLSSELDPLERKLILSVASFKERVAREVMVPRIDVCCLSAASNLTEAKDLFLKERYSRIPVFEENIDHVVGVLLYKDVFACKEGGGASIRSLIKPVLYAPETKKISTLLQEFRSRQNHLAIVIDEYGGTEGIVTTEDILEELVGEIADEDDGKPEELHTKLPSGGWVVDARMSIFSIEKELGVLIPPSPEYDTVGGYIFHKAGEIPSPGWKIHHDEFDLEVLSSDDRSVDKIHIIPKQKS